MGIKNRRQFLEESMLAAATAAAATTPAIVAAQDVQIKSTKAVSYTHLTLPTPPYV